jgi:hypothetical protein
MEGFQENNVQGYKNGGEYWKHEGKGAAADGNLGEWTKKHENSG